MLAHCHTLRAFVVGLRNNKIELAIGEGVKKNWLRLFPWLGMMLAAAAASADELNMSPGVTQISRSIYDLHMLIFWICVAIGSVVFGAMFWSVFRHRRSRGVDLEIKSHLIFEKIAEAEKLEVEDNEVHEEIAKIATSSGRPVGVVHREMEEGGRLASLHKQLIERKVLAFLREHADITKAEPAST